MPLLSREAILAAPVPSTEVKVPEWGGTVRVQALTVRLRVLLIDAVVANEAAHRAWKADEAKPEAERTGVERVDLYDQTIVSVLHAIVDEEGERMFDLTDYDAFTGLGYQSILDLWRAMSDLNTTNVETEKKSYAKTRKSSSSTGSRSRSAKP